MIFRTRFVASLAACFLAAASAARADWSLTSADFSTQKQLTVNTWDVDGLSVTSSGGNLVKVPTRDVVTLMSDRPVVAVNKPWRLMLRNGDVLYGEPVDISGQSLEYKADIGQLTIPLKNIQSLATAKNRSSPQLPASTDKDIIQLNNGDQMDGVLAAILPEKLQIVTGADPAGGVADISLTLVRQIFFGGVTPPRAVPPLSARLSFVSGSTLTVPLGAGAFAWTINDVSFADPANQPHKIASTQLTGVEILGGRVVYLTELDSVQDQQSPFIGGSWPTQINKNILGQDLRVANTTYSRGIGVHTRSLITYDLDGAFDTLTFRVGIDDSASPHGEADVSIVLDGKTLWQKSLKCEANGGEITEELSIPLLGGKHLELRANPVEGSGKLDVMGRVDWLNVALIRR